MLRFVSHFHRCFILIILAFFSKIMVTIRRPDERPCTIGGLYWRIFYAALKNTEDIEAGLLLVDTLIIGETHLVI